MAGEENVEVSGPGGWKAIFRGSSGLCVGVLVCVAAMIWFFSGKRDVQMNELIAAQATTAAQVKENTETLSAMIWVLTLPQGEREKLNLVRPRKIAEMQR